MSPGSFDRARLEELLFASVHESFTTAERDELNALLRGSAGARCFAVEVLLLDAALAENLGALASEVGFAKPNATTPAPRPAPFNHPNWLARAAVWAGAFTLFGKKSAHAAGTSVASPLASVPALLSQVTLSVFMTKTTLTLIAALILAGGSAIYFAQRDHQPVLPPVAEKKLKAGPARPEPGKGTAASTPPPPVEPPAKVSEEQARDAVRQAFAEQMKGVNGVMTKAMADRQRAKYEGQIQKLDEALTLTKEQKSGLHVWLDDRLAAIRALDLNDQAAMVALLKSISPQALDEELSQNLTEEQKATLADFRARETRKTVNSMVLKEMSLLQGAVEFEPEQVHKVYQILSDAAERKLRASEENVDPQTLFNENLGGDNDPYGLGVQQALKAMETARPASESNDLKAASANIRKVIDERIAAKVEQFRPVLNEKQLQQFRNELKTKTEEAYGPMLDLFDEVSGEK